MAGTAIAAVKEGLRGGLLALAIATAYAAWASPGVWAERGELAALAIAGGASVYAIAALSGRAAKDLERKWKALFNLEIAGIFISDAKGNILEANRSFAGMLKLRPEEVPGLRSDALTPADYAELDQSKAKELEETGRCKPWRKELLARDGTRVPVLTAAAALRNDANGTLSVALDLTDLKRVENNLQRLAGRLLNLYDDERRQISRELHDTTAQNLAALSMNLSMLSGVISNPDKAAPIVRECASLTEECLKEVRSLSYMLHPPLLDELGLLSALRSFVELFHRRTGIAVDLRAGPFSRLAPELELAAFRIAQEALFNVHRHSGSTRAEVALVRPEGRLEVSVRDWGVGVGQDALEQNSLGIAGMRERARLLGGQLVIHSVDPGTLVRVVFPVEPPR